MPFRTQHFALCVTLFSPFAATAGVCDFRLSELIGARATVLAEAASTAVVAGGLGMKTAGFYTLVHASSGLTMLGSTAAGVSGAGTVGIVSGTAGGLGAVSALVMNPITGLAAGAAALGIAGLEGVCYFQDERIDDYYEVLAILTAVEESSSKAFFQLQVGAPRKKAAVVEMWDPELEVRVQYKVEKLYFVNGELKYDRLGPFNGSLYYLAAFDGEEVLVAPVSDN